jgi:hypothetical protein
MSAQVLGGIFAVVVLVVIFFSLRNAHMKEKYGVWWVLIAVGVVVLLIPGVLDALSSLVGVKVPLNLAFFLGGVVVLLMQLQHSVALSQLEDRIRRQDEENALLRQRLDVLENG